MIAHVLPADRAAQLQRLRAHRAALYAAKAAPGQTGRLFDLWPAGITSGAGDVLRDLVVRERAASAVEIGTGLGLSSLAILDGLLSVAGHDTPPKLTTIDPDQHWCERAGFRTLADAGVVALTEIIEKPSCVALGQLLDQRRVFDFAFIDGGHLFDFVLVDMFLCMRLVRAGGVIVLDDVWMPSVQYALAFASSNWGCVIETFDPQGPGKRLAAIRSDGGVMKRAWDHFRPFSTDDLPAYPWG